MVHTDHLGITCDVYPVSYYIGVMFIETCLLKRWAPRYSAMMPFLDSGQGTYQRAPRIESTSLLHERSSGEDVESC